MHDLSSLGFSPFFSSQISRPDPLRPGPDPFPARVTADFGSAWTLHGGSGELRAITAAARPAVGDWVLAVRDGADVRIVRLLERRSVLARGEAGGSGRRQVVAANVDTVFVVIAPERDFSPRRAERFATAVADGGAEPVVLLNKADLCGDPAGLLRELGASIPAVALSAHGDDCAAALSAWLAPGKTVAFVGSSGVGKSTLVNRLLGEARQPTAPIGPGNRRGHHTTTRRDLFPMPGGALLVDTPGVREIRLLGGRDGLEAVFRDVGDLARDCRFRDCGHAGEPGCAVAAAVAEGRLDPARLASRKMLEAEQAFADRRDDPLAAEAEKRRWKAIHTAQRRLYGSKR